MPATSANVICCSPPSTRRALRAAEGAERAHRAAAGAAPEQEDEQRDQQDHRAEAEQQAGEEAAALVDGLGLDDDVLLLEQLRQLLLVGERRDLGLEDLRGLVVLELEVLLEAAVDGLAGGRDPLDVAVADLLEEDGVVRDRDRLDAAGANSATKM